MSCIFLLRRFSLGVVVKLQLLCSCFARIFFLFAVAFRQIFLFRLLLLLFFFFFSNKIKWNKKRHTKNFFIVLGHIIVRIFFIALYKFLLFICAIYFFSTILHSISTHSAYTLIKRKGRMIALNVENQLKLTITTTTATIAQNSKYELKCKFHFSVRVYAIERNGRFFCASLDGCANPAIKKEQKVVKMRKCLMANKKSKQKKNESLCEGSVMRKIK